MKTRKIKMAVITEKNLETISGGCGRNFCYIWEKASNGNRYCEDYSPAYPGKLFPAC